MAIKKSDLYSSLWASCDELRGGMDASQYKDYVLFMLFIKYISDKYGNIDDFAPPVTIPKGASFKDMIALKGKSDIGDKINTQIIQPLIDANARLARSDFPDFNDPNKLGEGQAMVDRLTNLIGIFQKPERPGSALARGGRAFVWHAGKGLPRRAGTKQPGRFSRERAEGAHRIHGQARARGRLGTSPVRCWTLRPRGRCRDVGHGVWNSPLARGRIRHGGRDLLQGVAGEAWRSGRHGIRDGPRSNPPLC